MKAIPELFADVRAAYAAAEVDCLSLMEVLSLMERGHPNTTIFLEEWIHDLSRCPCGAEDFCTPDSDPPTRRAIRDALTALRKALDT